MDISDENMMVSGRRESLAWRQISKNNACPSGASVYQSIS